MTQELCLAATGELRRARGVVDVFECDGVLSVPARAYLMWVMVLETYVGHGAGRENTRRCA